MHTMIRRAHIYYTVRNYIRCAHILYGAQLHQDHTHSKLFCDCVCLDCVCLDCVYLDCVCLHGLCLSGLCLSGLCLSGLCLSGLCLSGLCLSGLCLSVLCLSGLCLSGLCLSGLCLSGLCMSGLCLFQRSRDSIPLITHLIKFCSPHLHVQVAFRGYCSVRVGGNGQSIGYPVSDAIVHRWLWLTATWSCPLQ